MPRQTGVLVENSFTKGLNTDSNPLNYPTGFSTDTDNCVFDITGRVSRRLGIALEDNYQYSTRTISDPAEAFVEYTWTPVAGDSTLTFLVQQQGPTLFFYNVSSQTDTVSGAKFAQEITLTDPSLLTTTRNPDIYPCSFAQGNGDLFVCNAACEPFYIRYNIAANLFSANPITISFRDFEGAASDTTLNVVASADTLRFGVSLATLEVAYPGHYYNLQNQGWYIGDALSQWDAARTDLPSNLDIVGLYRSSATDAFDTTLVGSQDPGYTPAPRGHFIIDLSNGNRQGAYTLQKKTSVAGITLPASDANYITDIRPTTVAFFAGRIFYSGMNIQKYNGSLFFTQIIENETQYGRCYQRNDPTSEEVFELLPSDGGVLKILGVGIVTSLFSLQGALIVIASNGVWVLSGSNNAGFAANDYNIKKISSIGSISPLSVVDVAGTPMWWGEDGIYTLKYDPQNGNFIVESRSSGVIDTFFTSIPASTRKYVKGAYDTANFVVYWIYNNIGGSVPYTYTNVLCYNILSNAYYPWSVVNADPKLRGLVYVRDSNHISIPRIKLTITVPSTATTNLLSYGSFHSATYADWQNISIDGGSTFPYGIAYTSYFITGYTLPGQTQTFAQPNYIFLYFEQITDSSFRVQNIYEFATSANSGKFSSLQVVTSAPSTNRAIVTRRLKGRGKGRSIQMKILSTEGKPFTLVGWSTWMTMNANV